MTRVVWLALLPWPALAHVMSMSSGDLTVEGARGHYELRMPLYEVAHIKDPDRSIFENIHFSSGLREARLVAKSCRTDTAGDSYLCTADYEFAAPPDWIDVTCTYHSITVPNHVHLLVSESSKATPSLVLKVLKQRVSRDLRKSRRASSGQLRFAFANEGRLPRFWQPRFYDFNVWSERKVREKLEYMHANPVTRKLVGHPRDWPWSSWSFYAKGEAGLVPIDPV